MIYNMNNIKVYAFVGPSGTGKSYRAQLVASENEINYIIDELDFDDKIDVLDELPAIVVNKILEQTPKNERSQINTFLNYPDNCAGTLMTPEYISLQIGWTVEEALAHIKNVGMDCF